MESGVNPLEKDREGFLQTNFAKNRAGKNFRGL